jgi:GDPmannose 4,6-dehydratase
MAKTALITGASGQDGAYLSKFLLQRGYKVYGAIRRASSRDLWRFRELSIERDVEIVSLELLEESNIARLIAKLQPDELYNLAAQSFVGTSFEQPIYTTEVDAVGVCRILEAIRLTSCHTKFYQASTSEMFGKVAETPQSEQTPFYPRSPYGVAKLYAHWITVNYREAYNLFACSGLLFNHESPLRGPEFVTRKTTMALAEIREGRRDVLRLGNMDAGRDWGFAGDYVAGMWMMLNTQNAEDFILATGQTRTVRDFVVIAGQCLGFDIDWSGEGENEVGTDRKTGKIVVAVDPQFYRPAEVDSLVGNASKARDSLGWRPETSFDQMVEMMVRADADRLRGVAVTLG